MRIGELARQVGVSADTVRFYEREGLLPKPERLENGYRHYADADVEHLRVLIDLRSLEIPLTDAARVATMCHSGHCAETTRELPGLLFRQRQAIAERIDRLRALDARLADLGSHLGAASDDELTVIGAAACCDAAAAIVTAGEGRCACCAAT